MSTVTVGSTAALNSALASAHGGDTILLQAGTYSGLSMNGLNFATPVTISSADSAHQAVLTNFNIGIGSGVSGLTFSHLDFQVLTPNYNGFNIYSSSHMTFDQVHVYGPGGQPDPDVQAINFFDSSYITFTNSEIEQVSHGLTISRSDHITVSGNNIHNVNSDTLDFVQVSNAVISGNVLHDFFPTAGNHPDAMQFGTSNSTVASHDVQVTDNLIYAGAGQNSQGIFMSDEVGNLPFQNFTISNNTIVGTGASAIRATHNTGLVISGNDLFTLAGGSTTSLLVQFSDHVTLSNNTGSSISLTAANGNSTFTETNDVGNAPALTDGGAAVIQQWMSTHVVGPQGQPPVSPPPPPPPAVNHAPGGTDATQALAWHAAKVFASSDFGFSDTDGNHLAAVKLGALPSAGTLTDNGVAVSSGQMISVADINAGKLVYQAPATAGAVHVDLTFQVQDDGGVANGGVDLDPTANTLHFDVAAQPVSPPPPPPPPPVSPPPPPPVSPPPPPVSPPPPPVSPPAPPPTGTGNQSLVASVGHTQVIGGSGDDTITSGGTDDYLRGGDGNDLMQGGSAFDDINGNKGNDTIDGGSGGGDWLVGGQGNDLITAHDSDNILYGNLGNDTLIGGNGHDVIRGGQGDDSIAGGSADDFISGDLGNDTVTGGAGADTFHGFQNCGIDRITDFNQAEGDHILLDAGTTYSVTQIGADTIVVLGGGNQMVLAGVQLSSLHDGWLTVG